jgi:hypothetical protein
MKLTWAVLAIGAWVGAALSGCSFSFENPFERCTTEQDCATGSDGGDTGASPDAGRGAAADATSDRASAIAPSATFEFVDGDYATRRDPVIHIVASSDVTKIMLSESPGFVGAQWQSFSSESVYTFSTDGEQLLYLKASNDAGEESAPFGKSITIDTNPRVDLLAPSGTVDSSRPELTWTASRIKEATYAVEIATTADFSAPLEEWSGITSPKYLLSKALQVGPTYYWRVAIDDGGHRWAWSDAGSFRVDFGTVTLLYPGDGAHTNERTPYFKWRENPNAASYVLTLGTSPELSGAGTFTDIKQSPYRLPVELPPTPHTVYYWTLTPVDSNGIAGTPTEVRSFVLDTVAPTGSITLDGGGESTYSEMVDASLTADDASGVSEMQLSKDGSFTDRTWQPFTTTAAVEYTALAAVNQATITAHVRFRDRAGNESADAKDSIALVRTLVAGPIVLSGADWSAANNPYYVVNDVIFDTNPLRIGEGVEVYFKSGKRIEIRKMISAVGTSAAPIVMHGAAIDLHYLADGTPSFQPDGSYAAGPRFESVQMPDGTISILAASGPPWYDSNFYMRNCLVNRVVARGIASIFGSYIERSTVDFIERDTSDTALWLGNSRMLDSYIKLLRFGGASDVQVQHCRIDGISIGGWPGGFSNSSHLEFNDFQSVKWMMTAGDVQPTFDNNNISPDQFTIFSASGDYSVSIDATGNYWGAAATAEMTAGTANISLIHDALDDPLCPRVDYSGFLAAPVAGAGPDW